MNTKIFAFWFFIVLSMVLSACDVFGSNSDPAPTAAAPDQSSQIATQSAQIATLMAKLEATPVATTVSAGPTATAIPATATATIPAPVTDCTEDQIKYWNAFSFEIWPAGSNPGKAHWTEYPDGTLVVIDGKEPKGDLPLGIKWDGVKYTVDNASDYIIEWWDINTEKVEGIFTNSGTFDPTSYINSENQILFHFWIGATSARCRYDGDRNISFAEIPVYPDGNTLEEVRSAGVPDYAHLMQYLLKNESLGDMECRPTLVK